MLRAVDVQHNSDAALMTAVASQPVAVTIETDQLAMQFYSSGVITSGWHFQYYESTRIA
jgi:hypothetical protein